MDEETLAEVIRGAQRGDSAAFDRLVEAYSGRIFGFLYRVSGSKHDAEDLLQEVFLRVVRMIGTYEHTGRFESWLFRIAANLTRDIIRRAKRAPGLLSPDAGGGTADGGSRPTRRSTEIAGPAQPADADLIRREELDALGTALAKLPEAEREVMMLRHFSQMSFGEIAAVMDTPLGTALARAHRGLRRLRGIMNADHPGHSTGAHEEPAGLATERST
jgi:RNA polymerase sigma-70 factor (ECF subfamily)